MSIYSQAREVYAAEHCARSFEEDLRLHLHHGFVFSTPEFFIMGRPVAKSAPPSHIVDPCVAFDGRLCDCWHVYLAAGNLARAWNIMPYPLPWLSFERKNELRFYSSERIREHCLR